eukprot:2136068-Pleurochrysis_carterae.AAC.2
MVGWCTAAAAWLRGLRILARTNLRSASGMLRAAQATTALPGGESRRVVHVPWAEWCVRHGLPLIGTRSGRATARMPCLGPKAS